MAEVQFLGKLLGRIDRIDRASLLNYIRDLTAENESLKNVLDCLAAGVLVMDIAGKVKYLSRGAKSILGLSHSTTLRNKSSIYDLIKDEELRRFLLEHVCFGDYVFQYEIEILLPHHLYLSVSISPLEGANSPSRDYAVLLEDVTLSREHDRKMREIQKLDVLTRLAGGIAHEIGNPLNSIGIHLKLLERELASADPATQKKCMELLEVLQSESRRLDRLVKNFLKATRRKFATFKTESINEVIDAAVELMKPELKSAGIRVELKQASDIPRFLADSEKMKQVFINLIKNAIDAMPKGGSLEIGSEKRDSVCVLTFRDQGTGINERDLPHIFEAYYTTKKEGAGLGLMIVSGIIHEHGGKIEVQSKVGKGTVFKIYLPMRREKLQLPEKFEKG